MTHKPVLYGYSPSTYVRTVRMVLADNDVDYDQEKPGQLPSYKKELSRQANRHGADRPTLLAPKPARKGMPSAPAQAR